MTYRNDDILFHARIQHLELVVPSAHRNDMARCDGICSTGHDACTNSPFNNVANDLQGDDSRDKGGMLKRTLFGSWAFGTTNELMS